MTPIHVVGIGLQGATGLVDSVRQIVEQATVLVGSDRHLSYFPQHPAERIRLESFKQVIEQIRCRCSTPHVQIIILTSGDPLFFGLGRLLLAELPAELLTFHPHPSAVQLAFSRIKVPWQDAQMISAHGRSLQVLTQALQQGVEKIAVLTDVTNTPGAIARLLLSMDLPSQYQIWVCENLGGTEERVQSLSLTALIDQTFAALNVVILLRQTGTASDGLDLDTLPALGIPDAMFLSFGDRPGLITKREVRLLVLGELALGSDQIIWDVGAGTGSVSIEMARLCPSSQIFAIEKTAMGSSLIKQNCQRFQVENVTPIYGAAPDALKALPQPDRIFVGGSGGQLTQILDFCGAQLISGGFLVIALATLEHLNLALTWVEQQHSSTEKNLTVVPQSWQHRLLQVQLSRSVLVGPLTRFAPLNPVTVVILKKF
ncbi:MAG: precorrin-6y C5,15-methyltransferase (decarboxylating) subunit CbiE [Cyanothece sp. SIO1E1]|nr:precorrin-6y C5,15-methyltransferase (decarboxylating) subunit CbiE [Cyanothece sp. SIO1E1]